MLATTCDKCGTIELQDKQVGLVHLNGDLNIGCIKIVFLESGFWLSENSLKNEPIKMSENQIKSSPFRLNYCESPMYSVLVGA